MRKNVFVFCIVVICVLMCTNVFALTKLYETSEKIIINSGTNLTKYKRFTDKGWLSVNVVDVNLNDKNTSIGLLTSENGLQTFQNVKTMFDKSKKNCIVAINADFFNGTSKKGNIIGLTVDDGRLLTSTYYENEVKDVLASFILSEENEVIFDCFSNKITLANKDNDECISVSEINKWSSNYEYPVLYTKEWGENSLGSSEELVLTELVVEENKVIEVRYNEEPVKIPENGFVISTLGNTAEVIKRSFKKGDRVELDIDMELDINKVKLAVSGGTLLVENGEIAGFTHNIAGSNPRTAIGLSKDGEKVYLITIDGRQASSIGVTQTEFAEFLVEKGIYTAMNLDGGGSTTMITKRLGDELSKIENSPSDGSLRSVPNAIAVFNTEETGSLNNLLIEVDDVNVFVGCEKELKVKGYDKYFNPVEVDVDKIKWSYSGVPVSIKDNILTGGDVAGTSTVTATIGKTKTSINIDVLSKPNELTITPKKVTVAKGESVTFKMTGQNKNGYYANLKNSEVTWKLERGEASLKDGVFIANEPGDYIVSASCGNAKAYALVTIDNVSTKMINDFEKLNFEFKAYPDEVKGSVELSDEERYDGNCSAKLTYDFTGIAKTRAGYLRFNVPVEVDTNAEGIEFMMYSTVSTSDQVKLKITDANGTTKYLGVCKGLESSGWKEMKLDLSGIDLPAKLIDIYVAQDSESELTSGVVYIDSLKITYKSTAESSDVDLPRDIKGEDALNIASELESENAFRIVVSPEMKSGILLEHMKNKKLENVINNNSEFVILPAQTSGEMLKSISKDIVMANGYSVKNYKTSTIISLDVSDGGMRSTDSNQWISMQSAIKNGNKNILIVMNGNLNDFTDEAEKQLFIDVLCDLRRSTSKNIWVIQMGDNTDYSMKRGIKYLSIAQNDYSDPNVIDIKNTKYILITVNETKMTYEIKNVFEK